MWAWIPVAESPAKKKEKNNLAASVIEFWGNFFLFFFSLSERSLVSSASCLTSRPRSLSFMWPFRVNRGSSLICICHVYCCIIFVLLFYTQLERLARSQHFCYVLFKVQYITVHTVPERFAVCTRPLCGLSFPCSD